MNAWKRQADKQALHPGASGTVANNCNTHAHPIRLHDRGLVDRGGRPGEGVRDGLRLFRRRCCIVESLLLLLLPDLSAVLHLLVLGWNNQSNVFPGYVCASPRLQTPIPSFTGPYGNKPGQLAVEASA